METQRHRNPAAETAAGKIIIDMHAHLSAPYEPDMAARRKGGVFSVFSTGLTDEAENLLSAGKPMTGRKIHTALEETGTLPAGAFAMSCGIHPWFSSRVEPDRIEGALRPWLQRAVAVGEIGMDDRWCKISLDVQRKVLEVQLDLAAREEKPIVLHNTGQEAAVYDMVRDFPGRILVHWYEADPGDAGSMEMLDRYVNLGCWFTLGADQKLPVERIPIDRLFVETDGLDNLHWLAAHGELPGTGAAAVDPAAPDASLIPKQLRNSMAFLAEKKDISEEDLADCMVSSFVQFLG